jgi:hypothetical protein
MRNTHDTGNVDMSEDKLDFLDGEPAEVTPEPAPAEPVVLAEPKADKGEPPVQVAPASAPPAEPPKEQHVAPLTALLDEREKRQAAEREAAELRAWRQQQEAAQRAQQQRAPDPRQDPDGALAYERAMFQAQLTNTRLQTSRFLAEKDFGADVVKEAFEFFDKNPALSHQFVDHPSPFHAAVEFWKRQKVAEEVGADPVAYRARLEAEIREKLMAEMQAQPAQPKPRLPGSLAAAPAAGGAGEPVSKGSSFDAAFG